MIEGAVREDTHLIDSVKRGDQKAFEGMVEAYRPKVFATLYNLIGRYAEAEEAFWDVWTEVWKSIHRFRGDSSLSTWIYSITTHVAYHWRRSHRRTAVPLEEIESTAVSPSNPDQDVAALETSQALDKAIGTLPESMRVPLVLHAISELSYEEISKILKVPVGALKTRVWRAKLELKEVLQK